MEDGNWAPEPLKLRRKKLPCTQQAVFWGSTRTVGKGGVNFSKPAKASSVPFQCTPQNQSIGKEENGTSPDLIWTGTIKSTIPVRGLGKWHLEEGGKRKGGCLKATRAELWLQPPWKCSSQQGVILRNSRKNMSYLACAPAESAAPT